MIADHNRTISLEGAALDSPVFREEMRRTSDFVGEMGGRIRRLLKHLKDLRSAEDVYVAARRAVLDELDKLVGDVMPPSCSLCAPVRTVIQTLSDVESSRQKTAQMSVQVVSDPLTRFLDTDVVAAAEAYRVYQKSASQIDGIVEKTARMSTKEATKAAELESKAAELRPQHKQNALTAAQLLTNVGERFKIEVCESANFLATLNTSQASEIFDLFGGVSEVTKGLNSMISVERKACQARFADACGHKRHTEEEESVPDGQLMSFEGYMFKQSSRMMKGWKRKYFIVKDAQIFYFKNKKSGEGIEPSEVMDVVLTTVKPRPDIERRLCFELISPTKTFLLQAETQPQYAKWISVLENLRTSGLEHTKSDKAAAKSGPPPKELGPGALTGDEDHMINLRALWSLQPENKACCDCGTEDPEWVSLNLGIFFCLNCSGTHRSMGVSVSKVRSLKLDSVEPEALLLLAKLGNRRVNQILEANIPAGKPKPTKETGTEERTAWIKEKYVAKSFIAKSAEAKQSLAQRLRDACAAEDIAAMLSCVVHGADMDATFGPDNETCLHAAVRGRLVLSTFWLVVSGADLNKPGLHQYTPLHYAAELNFPELASIIVRGGANLSKKSDSGQTPMELATRKQNAHCSTLLKFAVAIQDETNTETRTSFQASLRDFERIIKSEFIVKEGLLISEMNRLFYGQPLPRNTRGPVAAPSASSPTPTKSSTGPPSPDQRAIRATSTINASAGASPPADSTRLKRASSNLETPKLRPLPPAGPGSSLRPQSPEPGKPLAVSATIPIGDPSKRLVQKLGNSTEITKVPTPPVIPLSPKPQRPSKGLPPPPASAPSASGPAAKPHAPGGKV